MVYVYDALISFGVFLLMFLAVARFFVWAVPRYGPQALAMALLPKVPTFIPPPVVPTARQSPGEDFTTGFSETATGSEPLPPL